MTPCTSVPLGVYSIRYLPPKAMEGVMIMFPEVKGFSLLSVAVKFTV
jgi:hypothetical protein